MKNVYFLLVTLCFLGSGPTVHAQIDMEDLKKAAQQYNDKEGYNEEPEIDKDSEAYKQGEKWKKQWEKTMEEYEEVKDFFNTKELNCVFLMVLYLDAYLDLKEQAESSGDCDLHGLEASAIALSTTIMYCPEHIAGLNWEEWRPVHYELVKLDNFDKKGPSVDGKIIYTGGEDYPRQVKEWVKKFREVCSRLNIGIDKGRELKDGLVYLFTPAYVVRGTLDIGRKMEALGCDDR